MKSLLVVTGPSAIGKTYLGLLLINRFPDLFEVARLFTTRKSRIGEESTDRIFVSEEEFINLQKSSKFVISDRFHNSWYGYTHEALNPVSKHVIVNAWPALIPQFSSLPNLYIVGLGTDNKSMPLLKQRMLDRGDSEKKVNERLELIKKDLEDLQIVRKIIEKNGKLFDIKDNQTIHNSVLPWITEKLLVN